MEHSMPYDHAHGRGEQDSYELEQRLASAERKYAQARELSRQAREECHALEAEQERRAGLVEQARSRYEKAEAKCKALKRLIEDLEDELG